MRIFKGPARNRNARAHASEGQLTSSPRSFDGYPYLQTKIESSLHHILLLPKEWTESELKVFARAQEASNQLSTCLVLGKKSYMYIDDAIVSEGRHPPKAHSFVSDRLMPAAPIEVTDERQSDLQRWTSRWSPSKFPTWDPAHGGRVATPDEVTELSYCCGIGFPQSIWPCSACDEYKGNLIHHTEEASYVVEMSCRCDSVNRCAACSELLASWKVRANHFDTELLEVLYTSGWEVLEHKCKGARKS
jgi:hypothetical protein